MIIKSVNESDPSYSYLGAKVVNWFDSTAIDPAFYSVEDTLGELRQNPKSGAIVNRMMEQASKSRGDVAEQVKDNPALQKMLERQKLVNMLKQGGVDKENVEKLNKVLQSIPKK